MADSGEIWRTAYRHPSGWDEHFAPLTLPDMLRASAARAPDAPLIDFMGRKFSYAAVEAAAGRVACGLAALGVAKGDRIGLFLPNVPHYVAAYFGILKLGAIVVNFSPLYTIEELAHQVADSGTRMLFTLSGASLLPSALAVMERSGLERLIVGSVAEALGGAKSVGYRLFRRHEIAPIPQDPRITAFSRLIRNSGLCPTPRIDAQEDVALLQYSGGTTGVPKGAMLTHQALTANARQIIAVDPDRDAGDRIIGVLPLFHIFANACVLNRTVLNGGEMVLLPRFEAGQVLRAVHRTRATSMPGVPTMYQALLDHPRLARTDFTSLRICVSGGAPLPSELGERFVKATGARLIEGYGLTEAGVAAVNPYAGESRCGTVGQPLPATRFMIAGRDDAGKPADPDAPGEIVVAGPQLMKGYWNDPHGAAAALVDGALRTGDVGLIDADGYVRVIDRLKDMISVHGFKVFPNQIEKVLHGHPAVREVLVIGVDDPYAGERPKAFVTLNEDAAGDADALLAWLNPRLGKHERVIAVEIRATLPKTATGKLSRKLLLAEMRGEVRAA